MKIKKPMHWITTPGIIFMMLLQTSLCAQTDSTVSGMLFDLAKTIRIDASLFFGIGFKEFDVFKTTRDEIVSLSPGGGAGATLSLGYYFNQAICVNAGIGLQSSPLSKELKNADGSFNRTFVNGTIRYKFLLSQSKSINAGAGGGYYMSAEMDIDAHKIDEGGHNIYYFKDTPGFHIICEYEEILPDITLMNAKWSWLIGLKYYHVKYELESAKSDGTRIPVEFLSPEIIKDFKDLDGSGFDICVSIIMHI